MQTFHAVALPRPTMSDWAGSRWLNAAPVPEDLADEKGAGGNDSKSSQAVDQEKAEPNETPGTDSGVEVEGASPNSEATKSKEDLDGVLDEEPESSIDEKMEEVVSSKQPTYEELVSELRERSSAMEELKKKVILPTNIMCLKTLDVRRCRGILEPVRTDCPLRLVFVIGHSSSSMALLRCDATAFNWKYGACRMEN